MPITYPFDLDTDSIDHNHRNRIRVAIQCLGWEAVGGTAYRYPPISSIAPEDWLMHVVPALAYFFRALVEKRSVVVKSYSLDAHPATGFAAPTLPQEFSRSAPGPVVVSTEIAFGQPSSTPDVVSEGAPSMLAFPDGQHRSGLQAASGPLSTRSPMSRLRVRIVAKRR